MGVCVDIANMIFDQSCEKVPDFESDKNLKTKLMIIVTLGLIAMLNV